MKNSLNHGLYGLKDSTDLGSVQSEQSDKSVIQTIARNLMMINLAE